MKKICKRCGQELPIENYAKNLRSSDGYMHICNECWVKAKAEGHAVVRKIDEQTPAEKPIKQNDMKKICKRCGQELPIENYAKNLRSSDGYMHICNECWVKAKAEGHAVVRKIDEQTPAEPSADHVETLETIQQSHESLAQTIAESKVQNEKIHQLTLKALELFDDKALIQALRDRGFSIVNGELHKKFIL